MATSSAKHIWDGQMWRAREIGDCPFGNQHYILFLTPAMSWPVYCHECEQQPAVAPAMAA